jgi:alpha-N-arabinofuranosidase
MNTTKTNQRALLLSLAVSLLSGVGPATAQDTGRAGAAAQITINAGEIGAPISKYIYGQFIEHLGRCIYGGIWAEMIQDRKFFYAVGAKESPWQAVGSPDAVTMSGEGAFVGEHSPVVTLAGDGPLCGLTQSGLGLLAGRVYVGHLWLAGAAEAGPVSISLVWGKDEKDRQTLVVKQLTPEFARTSLRFVAGSATEVGRLEIVAAGRGSFRVGTVSLMPADNVRGMRADTIGLLRRLGSPVYRWPGGNFVSGYNWKDGLGDRDRRPPRKNPAWQGIEPNDFGLDEFMNFCRVVGAEAYITVNSGLGDSQSAVQEVEYANGGAATPMGAWRTRNGHPQPYGVQFWSIGNEMYGNWQLGHMNQDKYIEKHNQFAAAMRAADPTIKLVAVGDAGKWSELMLTSCADHMDLISEHFYCQEKPDLAAHIAQIPEAVRRKVEAHRDYRARLASLKGKDIRIALDEWNYWYGPQVFGELGTRYYLKDALGIAAGLNEMARNSDLIFMANYAQTVNVIGCIKTSKIAAAFETTGLVLELYRQQFGTLPVTTTATGGIRAQAAWSTDRKALTVAIINPSLEATKVTFQVSGAELSGRGKRWQIAGTDPQAYNDPDRPPHVRIEEDTMKLVDGGVKLAPCSVTLLRLAAH